MNAEALSSNPVAGFTAADWKNVLDLIGEQKAEIERLRVALFECFCYYTEGPVHEARISGLLPNDEVQMKRIAAMAVRT